jgi:hypothetical protein
MQLGDTPTFKQSPVFHGGGVHSDRDEKGVAAVATDGRTLSSGRKRAVGRDTTS